MRPRNNEKATRTALGQIRPGRFADIDEERHPHLASFAREARNISSSPTMWATAYQRFGDEMESTMAEVIASGVPHSVAALPFASALDDPWVLTGQRATELGEDFFLLWNHLYGSDMSEAVGLVFSPIPARAREVIEWMNLRLRFPRRARYHNADRTWMDVFGRTLRFPPSYGAASWRNSMYAITESDLYEFMDADHRPDRSDEAPSLQQQLAVLRGTWSEERAALAHIQFSYPYLPPKVLNYTHPLTSSYIEQADYAAGEVVDVESVALDSLEAALEGTEGFDVQARRERIAFGVEEVSDIWGSPLSPAQQTMWDATLSVYESPHVWFPSILDTSMTPEDAKLVVSWMGDHMRPPVLSVAETPWVSLALASERPTDYTRTPIVQDEAEMVNTLVTLIRDGHAYDSVTELTDAGYSLEETALVLSGVPREYVLATRAI